MNEAQRGIHSSGQAWVKPHYQLYTVCPEVPMMLSAQASSLQCSVQDPCILKNEVLIFKVLPSILQTLVHPVALTPLAGARVSDEVSHLQILLGMHAEPSAGRVARTKGQLSRLTAGTVGLPHESCPR